MGGWVGRASTYLVVDDAGLGAQQNRHGAKRKEEEEDLLGLGFGWVGEWRREGGWVGWDGWVGGWVVYLKLALAGEHGLGDGAGREGDGDEGVDEVGGLATAAVGWVGG